MAVPPITETPPPLPGSLRTTDMSLSAGPPVRTPKKAGWLRTLFWTPLRPAENWAQTLVRVAGNLLRWIIGLPVVVGLIGWGVFSLYNWWADRPYHLTGLEGVEIGMTMTDVTLLKGAPTSSTNRFQQYVTPRPPADTQFVTQRERTSQALPQGMPEEEREERRRQLLARRTELLADQTMTNWWENSPIVPQERAMTFGGGLLVTFSGMSEDAWRVSRVCQTNPNYWEKLIGVSRGDAEADVTRHLGQPDSIRIDDDGLSKLSFFEDYNLTIRFERARVVGYCVGT